MSFSEEFHYCLESSCELGEITIDQLCMFDIINVSSSFEDNIHSYENTNYIDIITSGYYFWFNNIATQIEKTELYYKFLFYSNFQLNEFITDLANNLTNLYIYLKYKELPEGNKIFLGIIENRLEELLSLNIFEKKEDIFKLKHLNKLKLLNNRQGSFFNNYLKHLNVLNFNAKHTLTEVIDNIIVRKNNKKIENNNRVKLKIKENNIKITKESKKVLLRGKKAFENIIGKEEYNTFVKGENFEVQGKLFNYKISKIKNSKSLVELTQISQNKNLTHIPYQLDLYDKENRFLANCCVYFEQTPILDQIISIYFYIKENELKLIETANLFHIQKEAYLNNTLKELKFNKKKVFESKELISLKIEKEIKENMLEDTTEIENKIEELSFKDEDLSIENKLKKIFPEDKRKTEKQIIKNKLKGLLKKAFFYKSGINKNLIDFIFQPSDNLNTLIDMRNNNLEINNNEIFLLKYKNKDKLPKFEFDFKTNPNLFLNLLNN